ncbi:hypothetical protein ACFU7Y_37590 [Kitasatospora sp. NPDC057542]|uniref:hypothetical protein n=1 Tax=Kitasatospora sp. NPDC057542 TaxID=3346162 RepID=UPI0036859B28
MSSQTVQEPRENGAISQRGPVPSVSVFAHMRSGPTRVVYPLDLLILVELGFMFGEQARQPQDAAPLIVTPPALVERLQGQGVVSANGSGLVSRASVYESFKRLIEKGYIRRINLRSEDGRRSAGVAYEYYEWPAYNPDYRPASDPADDESPQVRSASGNAGSSNAGSREQTSTKNRSPQVKSASGNAGSSNAGSRGKNSAFPQVRSASGNAANPPHPPGEVGTTSSPSPHGRHLRDAAAAPRRDRADVGSPADAAADLAPVDPELFQAAVDFLMRLPGKWAVGRLKARNLAAELVRATEDTGWKLDASLRMWLTRAEEGKAAPRVHGTVLEFRIKNLELRESVFATEDATSEQAAVLPAQVRPQAKPRTPDWCGKCNGGEQPMSLMMRTIADPDLESDRVLPCPDCHPSRVRFAR